VVEREEVSVCPSGLGRFNPDWRALKRRGAEIYLVEALKPMLAPPSVVE